VKSGPPRARTWLRALAVAAGLHVVAGAGLWWLLRLTSPPPRAPSPAAALPPGAIPYDIDLQNTPIAPGTVATGLVPRAASPPPVSTSPPRAAESPAIVAGSVVSAAPTAAANAPSPSTPSADGRSMGPPSSTVLGAPQPPQLHGNAGGPPGPAGPPVPAGPPGPVGVVGLGPDRDQLVARAVARIRAERHYPELARRRGIEGTVHITFVVGADGHPRDITVRRGADPLLDEAAREAVLRAAPLPPLGPAELDLDFHLDD